MCERCVFVTCQTRPIPRRRSSGALSLWDLPYIHPYGMSHNNQILRSDQTMIEKNAELTTSPALAKIVVTVNMMSELFAFI